MTEYLLLNRCTRRSLLPFLGDVLSWLTGTTTTKDVNSIKNVGQYTNCNATQTGNSSTYYICFKCNQICYSGEQTAYQSNNGCSRRTHQDVTMFYNITSSLYTSLNYQQIVLHICSILTNLRDSLYYMRQVTMHAMDYIDAATTGML